MENVNAYQAEQALLLFDYDGSDSISAYGVTEVHLSLANRQENLSLSLSYLDCTVATIVYGIC